MTNSRCMGQEKGEWGPEREERERVVRVGCIGGKEGRYPAELEVMLWLACSLKYSLVAVGCQHTSSILKRIVSISKIPSGESEN